MGKHYEMTNGERAMLWKDFGSYVGENVKIGKGTKIGYHCQIYDGVVIGSNCTIQSNIRIAEGCVIGDNVVFKHGAVLTSHTTVKSNSFFGPYSVCLGGIADKENLGKDARHDKHTVIGERVYVGEKATIFHGVEICDDVIIGDHTRITKDITESGTYVGAKGTKLQR